MNSQSLTAGNKRTFEAIDIMKFICSILVVAIHVPPLGTPETYGLYMVNYTLQHYVAKIGVPFFFVCTGYLLFRRTDRDSFSIRQTAGYIKKTYRLHFIWTLIYLPLTVKSMLASGNGILQNLIYFVRNYIFIGGYGHLWYLNASAFAVLLISILLHKRVKVSRIIIGAFILYLIGLLPQTYFGLLRPLKEYPSIWNVLKAIRNVISTSRNGLFEGFLFVGMGMLFAYKPIQMSTRHAVIGFCVSMLLMLIEAVVLTRNGWVRADDIYLFLIPATFYLFYIVSHIELKGSGIYTYLRTISSLVYFVHMWIRKLGAKAFRVLGIDALNTCLPFLTVLIISIIVSVVIIKLSEYRRFRWLKMLYS